MVLRRKVVVKGVSEGCFREKGLFCFPKPSVDCCNLSIVNCFSPLQSLSVVLYLNTIYECKIDSRHLPVSFRLLFCISVSMTIPQAF